MVEEMIGEIVADDDEIPEVEATGTRAGVDAFAAEIAAISLRRDPQVARDTSAFLRDQSELLKVPRKHLEDEHAHRFSRLRGQSREGKLRRTGIRMLIGFQLFLAVATTVIGFGGSLVSAHAAAPTVGPAPADLLFVGGAIYTVDATRSWATALAVSGERIGYVGDEATARSLAGPATRIIDLKGRMLLPAFQDSHVHPGSVGDPDNSLTLYGLVSQSAIFERIRAFVRAHPRSKWIVGDGWDEVAFLPAEMPTREMLDALVPDRPAILYDNSGHSAWVNSRALALAHITVETPDPPNGRIQHDANGRPTGILHEDSAMALVQAMIPPITDDEELHNLTVALQRMREDGFTALEDAEATPEIARAYQALDSSGTLNMRVNLCLPFDPSKDDEPQIAYFLAQRTALAGRMLRATCVKLFIDGAAAGHTLAMLEPYSDEGTLGRGNLFIDKDRLNRLVTRLDAAGFQVHMHAQGDWAVRAGLDSFAEARRRNGITDHRHTIAHLWVVDPADVPRFRALGVIANLTPLWSLGDTWELVDAPKMFGPVRVQHMYPSRSLLDSGAIVVWGSDWPVTGVAALDGIETAITHRYPGGKDPFGKDAVALIPHERVNLEQALVAYTAAGAYLLHDEAERGTLEKGKLADLVVLDRNLFELAPVDIHAARVDMIVLAGQVIYTRGPEGHKDR